MMELIIACTKLEKKYVQRTKSGQKLIYSTFVIHLMGN